MKKLTESWKVKKGNLKNKSFHDSIDYALSNTPESEKIKRNLHKKIQKCQPVNKSSILSIKVAAVDEYEDDASPSLRRSNRLKEKSNSVKQVEKKSNYTKDEVNFSFNESFGLKMANEASKYEKQCLYDTRVFQSIPTEKQNLMQNPENTSDDTKSSKLKDTDILYFDNLKKPEMGAINKKNLQENSVNVDLANNVPNSFKENEVEKLIINQCSTNSSTLSKNNSVFEEEDCLDLAYWGLPSQVISAYKSRNINKMFQWQYECLSMKNILNGKNLVYSAPTSAGKTLVAEILMLKKVIESKKKAMMILPFVSVVREKVNYLQEMFQDAGVVVGGYMGAYRPPGGFKATDIAICTIEKSNNLINRLMEEKRLDELGILVVDELHMLGDNSRGYLLELLLTKLLYNCKKNNIDIQIIGMSATLPNLSVLSSWLNAELYYTDFRPIPLHEMYKVGPAIYDSKTANLLRDLGKNTITFANDSDHTIYLTIETVSFGNGVLLFCPSKNWCETLATSIAKEIFNTGRPVQDKLKNPAQNLMGQKLREHINGSLLNEILLQLKNSPAGIDPVLKLTVPFGVAFHHAGLTYDERDIIEGAFKQGILKVLAATTTLSSGVNLPARRVLIRSPLFCGAVIDTLSYKQMVGRAGRKGIDDQGESILLCKETERKAALQLVASDLQPVKSCLMKSGKDGVHSSLKRAIIEVIASGAAVTHEEVIQYSSCTLLFASLVHENSEGTLLENGVQSSINKCLAYLLDNDFIFKIEKVENDCTQISYKPSQLGVAILASGFSPEDSLRILKELQLARRSFVLENDLHILYQVTPPYLSDQMGSINWMNFLSLWEQLPEDYRRVGELVGVRENFIGMGIQGKIKMSSAQTYHKLAVHQRFYAALALNDLIQEVPLPIVSQKYNCNKGILQSLQQTTSTFSGMLTIFCNRLGWYNLELLFSHFQKRVHFGIQQELCNLIQLSTLNAQRARILYNSGYETITSLAAADPDELELVLCNAGAFESEKQLDGEIAEEAMKRREVKRIRITGKQGVNEREAARLIIEESQNFIKHELGIKAISWQSSNKENITTLHKKNDTKIPDDSANASQNAKDIINKSILESESDTQSNKNKNANINCKLSNKSNIGNIVTCVNENPIGQNSEADSSNSRNSQKSMLVKKSVEKLEWDKSSQNKTILDSKKESAPGILYPYLNQSCLLKNNALNLKLNVKKTEELAEKLSNQFNGQNQSSNAKIVQNVCDKNDSHFSTEDVNNLFIELEKTILDQTQNMHSPKNNPKSCAVSIANDDLVLNQLLLSQSAELEDVYFSQSFLNSDFQNCSFSDCVGNNNEKVLSNSKIQDINSKFTSKKTRDLLDVLFDSPVTESEKEKQAVSNNKTDHLPVDSYLHLSDIDAMFDSPNFDNVISNKENKIDLNYARGSFLKKCSSEISDIPYKIDQQKHKEIEVHAENGRDTGNNIFHKSCFNNFNINQKTTSQSTPIKDSENYMKNHDLSTESCSHSFINNCNLELLDCNFSETKKKSKMSDSSKNSETSADLFDSEESLDGDILNKAEVIKVATKNLENPVTVDENIQCVSSCSDEIFNSDKSFERMLDNHCVKNGISDLNDEFSNERVQKKTLLSSNVSKNKDETINDCKKFKILDMSKFSLEDSCDLFDEATDSEPIFEDPKKHLSFEYEGNSEFFKTWNLSPNKIIKSESLIKNDAMLKKSLSSKESNLKNVQDESFFDNISDLSNFSSDCLEDTPPEKIHLIKSVLLQASVPRNKISSVKNVVKDKAEDKNVHQVKTSTSCLSNLLLEKSLPSVNNIKFNVINVIDENFDNFLKLLEKASVFGFSISCEKVEHKTAVNIGPPKLRVKKCSSTEKICVSGDILIAGLSFCWNENVFFVKFSSNSDDDTKRNHLTDIPAKLKLLQQLFHRLNGKIITAYDIKSYYKILWRGCNIILPQMKEVLYLDPSIAAWLLQPSDGQQSIQELVLNYWSDASFLIEGFDRGHGGLGLQHWSSVSGQKRAVTEAYISFHLIKILSNQLTDKKLFKTFVDIEMPSVLTLAKMEQIGIGFDLKLAMNNRKELQQRQSTILKKAYQLAGHSFNMMSSKALSRILYKELKLNPSDTNASPMASRHLSLGISAHSSAKKLPPELKTNKECLEKIMHLHPLPKTIMDWRKLSFAVSKVLMPLLKENKFNSEFQLHRIYSTCYVYTVTGRINMHTPNLQFVPRDFNVNGVNSDETENDPYYEIDNEISLYGVSLRNMFVPAEGNVLLSADYSQLELRILAHLSGDVKLLKSLNGGDDIFKQIASSWKNILICSVTDEIRQQAKKICYGIIYGMSAKSLAHQLQTTENEASYFMESFKKVYPGVTYYLNSVVENCRNKGYVTTIMDRRRYLSHILSENKAERAQAERQAINTTIQGSAADIIKKATIEIERQLQKEFGENLPWNIATSESGTKSSKKCRRGGFLVLQLHDELIYEVSKSDLELVKNIVKTVMEGNTKLSVILPVNIKTGLSWGSMQKVS